MIKKLQENPELICPRAEYVLKKLVHHYSYRQLAPLIGAYKDSIYNWVNGKNKISRDKAKNILRFVGEYEDY